MATEDLRLLVYLKYPSYTYGNTENKNTLQKYIDQKPSLEGLQYINSKLVNVAKWTLKLNNKTKADI